MEQKNEFEEYVGLHNGKWNGIIERIFVGTDEELKKLKISLKNVLIIDVFLVISN